MATQTTEIAYPPLHSQSTTQFIDSQVAVENQTGSLQDDFKLALATKLSLDVNLYSIDDLWKRYVLAEVATDSNANDVASARGHRGQGMAHYYSKAFRRNSGNANEFPGQTDPDNFAVAPFTLQDFTHERGGTIPTIVKVVWTTSGRLQVLNNSFVATEVGVAVPSVDPIHHEDSPTADNGEMALYEKALRAGTTQVTGTITGWTVASPDPGVWSSLGGVNTWQSTGGVGGAPSSISGIWDIRRISDEEPFAAARITLITTGVA